MRFNSSRFSIGKSNISLPLYFCSAPFSKLSQKSSKDVVMAPRPDNGII